MPEILPKFCQGFEKKSLTFCHFLISNLYKSSHQEVYIHFKIFLILQYILYMRIISQYLKNLILIIEVMIRLKSKSFSRVDIRH